jgi:uncharacterized membrane protein
MKGHMKNPISHISKKPLQTSDAYKGDLIRKPLFDLIKQDYPDFERHSYLSIEEVNYYRKLYLKNIIKQEVGELDHLENQVLDAISGNKLLSENIEEDIEERLTFGQRMADKIASFGGSWNFIIIFFSFILLWIMINIWVLLKKPFDPFPFILLNLILSCLASIQAPIIMMSQNRQEQKDRQRSEHDYKVNLKAELEIKLLHEKVDHMVSHQNKLLLEIQEIQSDYLSDILHEVKNGNGKK